MWYLSQDFKSAMPYQNPIKTSGGQEGGTWKNPTLYISPLIMLWKGGELDSFQKILRKEGE